MDIDEEQTTNPYNSGIFGYINYLVEKDRKFIVDTLVNGKSPPIQPAAYQWPS